MKKLQIYFVILLLSIITSCKKEKVNNPDIKDVTLNLIAEAIYPTLLNTLDVNIDGEIIIDFKLIVAHTDVEPYQNVIYIDIYDNKYEFLSNGSPGMVYTPIKTIQKNSSIQPSLTTWKGGSIFLYFNELDITKFGFSDIGDQYIAFRKRNTNGGYQYGWMLVNIENGEKITIKEYALHKIADTPIKAGEK